MINPNNLKQLGEEIAECIDRIIPESQLEKLSPKQRSYIVTLIHLNSVGEKTFKGEEPIAVIKDIVGIKPYFDKKDSYLKMKFNK